MKKTQIVSILIGALILMGFVSSFSYWLGQKSVEVKSETLTANPLESKVIQNWEAFATGMIINKSENSFTVEANEETLNISIQPKTIIKRALLENKGKKIEEISFEDVKIGDEVNIEIGVDQAGKIWANLITVLPK